MNKFYNKKEFKITENLVVECFCQNTRYGFRHVAALYDKGRDVATAKRCYYNRTWESFEYQSVLRELLRACKGLTTEDRNKFLENAQTIELEKVNKQFGMIGAIMKMGEILTDNQKDANDWKTRMLKAGLGEGISIPSDWDTLTEDEKETRLNKVIEFNTRAK